MSGRRGAASAPRDARSAQREPRAALRDADPLELALRLLLVVVLLDAPPFWLQRVPTWLCAAAGLVVPGWLRSPGLWALLVALAVWPLGTEFPLSDNHDYLRAVVCVAALCATLARDPAGVLRHAARVSLGLVFAFALLWKVVLSPDFVDGTFFRVTLATDGRFQPAAMLLGGSSAEQWEANAERFYAAVRAGDAPLAAGFEESGSLRRAAWAATAATALAEAWIALAFLWPVGRGLSRTRDAALLLFALATYPLAPVRGFGWLLMVLGLASTGAPAWRTRAAYLAVFGAITLSSRLPWLDWLG